MDNQNTIHVTPLYAEAVGKIYLTAMLDPRYHGELSRIVVRIAYSGTKNYLSVPTIDKVTFEAYEKIVKAKGAAGVYSEVRRAVKVFFDKTVSKTRELAEADKFSYIALRDGMNQAPTTKAEEQKTLLEYWRAIADSKEKHKTKGMYYSGLRSFYKYLGCTVTFENAKSSNFAIKGRMVNIMPGEVTEKMVKGWEEWMAEAGNSVATRSVYLRAMRAVMYDLRDEQKVIKAAPKMTIKAGARRKEDYLKVPDIVRVRDYEGPSKEWADWWIILYLCNGCNMKDLAQLEWGNDYFNNNELSFIRSKTEGKAPVKVYIPVTDELTKYLGTYGSRPEAGKRVFPQILGRAKSDTQITNSVHRYNMNIRKGMDEVCEALGIRQDKAITASTARNSYITTLTWHQVSDAFIDAMVGHADGSKVLRGYQGTISPKKRAKVNGLLFVDPETED